MGRKSVKLDIISLSEGDQILESIMGRKELLEKVEGGNVAWVNYYNKLDAKDQIPSCPKTIAEIIIEDITKKSKLIAFTAIMGPSYGENFAKINNSCSSADQAREEQEAFDFFLDADTPEDVDRWKQENL